MYMAEKLDAGDIISQSEVKITEQDDVGSLHDKLSVIGADLLSDTIPKIFNEQIEPIKQEEALATFAPNITREQEKKLNGKIRCSKFLIKYVACTHGP